MRRLSLLAPALLLAACGGDRQEEQGAPAPGETPSPSDVDLEGDTPPQRTPEATAIAIPARYHGVWDAVGGSCQPSSDLRVEIEPQRIIFYESVGSVTGMSSRGSDAVAELAMEGEGEQWSRSLRMTLSGEGGSERLVLADALETPRGNPIPLTRCPR